MGEIRIVGSGKTRGYPYPYARNRQLTVVEVKYACSNYCISPAINQVFWPSRMTSNN